MHSLTINKQGELKQSRTQILTGNTQCAPNIFQIDNDSEICTRYQIIPTNTPMSFVKETQKESGYKTTKKQQSSEHLKSAQCVRKRKLIEISQKKYPVEKSFLESINRIQQGKRPHDIKNPILKFDKKGNFSTASKKTSTQKKQHTQKSKSETFSQHENITDFLNNEHTIQMEVIQEYISKKRRINEDMVNQYLKGQQLSNDDLIKAKSCAKMILEQTSLNTVDTASKKLLKIDYNKPNSHTETLVDIVPKLSSTTMTRCSTSTDIPQQIASTSATEDPTKEQLTEEQLTKQIKDMISTYIKDNQYCNTAPAMQYPANSKTETLANMVPKLSSTTITQCSTSTDIQQQITSTSTTEDPTMGQPTEEQLTKQIKDIFQRILEDHQDYTPAMQHPATMHAAPAMQYPTIMQQNCNTAPTIMLQQQIMLPQQNYNTAPAMQYPANSKTETLANMVPKLSSTTMTRCSTSTDIPQQIASTSATEDPTKEQLTEEQLTKQIKDIFQRILEDHQDDSTDPMQYPATIQQNCNTDPMQYPATIQQNCNTDPMQYPATIQQNCNTDPMQYPATIQQNCTDTSTSEYIATDMQQQQYITQKKTNMYTDSDTVNSDTTMITPSVASKSQRITLSQQINKNIAKNITKKLLEKITSDIILPNCATRIQEQMDKTGEPNSWINSLNILNDTMPINNTISTKRVLAQNKFMIGTLIREPLMSMMMKPATTDKKPQQRFRTLNETIEKHNDDDTILRDAQLDRDSYFELLIQERKAFKDKYRYYEISPKYNDVSSKKFSPYNRRFVQEAYTWLELFKLCADTSKMDIYRCVILLKYNDKIFGLLKKRSHKNIDFDANTNPLHISLQKDNIHNFLVAYRTLNSMFN